MPSPGMRVTSFLPSGVVCMAAEAPGLGSPAWKNGGRRGSMRPADTTVLGTVPPGHKGGTKMAVLVLDPTEQRRLKRERRLSGADRFDEVWNGVYVMAPLANNEHQYLAMQLCLAIASVVKIPDEGLVFAGVNVSDRAENWEKNYRCPDVAVFLKGNPAED